MSAPQAANGGAVSAYTAPWEYTSMTNTAAGMDTVMALSTHCIAGWKPPRRSSRSMNV